MVSVRIKTIASFIEEKDTVLDVGCDHCYLGIYLIQNKKCTSVLASDIHEQVVEIAKKNVKKQGLEENITLFLTDGMKGISEYYDTVVIAGMGAHTIVHILERKNSNIKKLVIQSNNELPYLRKELFRLGYYLQEEKVIYEKKHYYVIGLYTKIYRRLTLLEKKFGIYNSKNTAYYQHLYENLKGIDKQIQMKDLLKKMKIKIDCKLLNAYLKKECN